MPDTEIDALAKLLWALHAEALGYLDKAMVGWDDLKPYEREAWIQVVEYIAANFDAKVSPDHR